MKNALLEAIAMCLHDEAHIECECNYQTAEREGAYHSVCTAAYGGPGKPKNLVSVFAYRDLVTVYIPRIKSLGEFQQRHGFPASKIMSDKATMTPGKPYHCVEIDSTYFDPLTKGGDSTLIRRFLITAVREALALRGISPAGLAKLRLTASLVLQPSSPREDVKQGGITMPDPDPHPDLTKEMRDLYRRTYQALKYNAHDFLQLLEDQFGYATAIQLVLSKKPPSGFAYLWKKGRLDLTVESLVLQPEWCKCFPDAVLLAAHHRLEEYNYAFPDNLWKPSQSASPTPLLPPTPPAPDLDERPTDRVKTTTYRILRDTEKALRVKALHEYRCQICGHRITLPDGTFYAEAHHIQPLGEDGPDSERNIICVCPNHHAELDYCVIPLDLAILKKVQGHSIDPKFVTYHNHARANQG